MSPGLVRGLDYYTRTLFEIQTTRGEIGSQNALLGGGRYDGMIKELGGPDVPAIGFALGLERVLLALPDETEEPVGRCFVAPLGERALIEALGRGAGAASRRRRDGAGHARGLVEEPAPPRGRQRRAPLRPCSGDNELERGVVLLKDLKAHTQLEVPRAELAARAQAMLAGGASA